MITEETPPITPERRKDWHTPDDCHKLLDVQTAMDKIFARFKEVDERMDSIFGHLIENRDRIDCIEGKIDINNKALAENTAKTDQTYEIVEMGRGLFEVVAFVGKWFRRIVIWVASVVTAIYSIWYAINNRPN